MNTASRTGIFIALLIFLGTSTAHAQDKLDNYLIEAAKNNPGLQSKFDEYLAALEQVPQVGALPDPQLTFGYFISPVETRVGPQRVRISGAQMFPWFGTLGAKKDVATAKAKAKYEMFEEVKSRLFFDVKSTYYNLYFIQKAIVIMTENIDILGTFRKLALIKVESGLASSVDVLRVEIELADLEDQLALLKDGFDAMRTGFDNLLNVEQQRPVYLPDTLVSTDFTHSREAILDTIRNGNHQVLQAQYQEAMYAKQEMAARRMGLPSFTIGLDYIFIGESSNPMAAASESGKDAIVFPMIGISVPLYRHKYSSMAKEAALMRKSTSGIKLDRINELETTLAKANKDYRDADRRIPFNAGQSDKAGRALKILQTSFETSGADFAEILRMERQLLKYRLELEKARTDKGAAVAFINYLMGK